MHLALTSHSLSLLVILLYIPNVLTVPLTPQPTPEPTGTMEYVYIPESEYVQGPYDYNGDPCSGAATIDGDIALPLMVNPETNTSYILTPSVSHSGDRRRRGATADPNKLWPSGIVYYAFHSSITENVRNQIYHSMHHWEEYTCIRFVARTFQRNYIEFFRGGGCCSFIGLLNRGRQFISIGQYCNYFPSITHEIGHSIGFWHEMNRPDRDEYIQINYGNIPIYLRHNFNKLPFYYIDSRGITYDYNSVMHYTARAFSINGNDTIEAVQTGIPIGPEYGLSQLDVVQANLMYSCHNFPNRRSTLPIISIPTPEDTFSTSCGSLLSGELGTFSYSLRNGDLCQWLIHGPEGHHIRLVVDMNIPKRSGSCVNGLEVIDGNQMKGYTHGNYCGVFHDYRFQSTYNYMLLKMHIVNRALTVRFSAQFVSIDRDECAFYGRFCQNGCANIPGGFTCLCDEGYFVSRNNRSCFDINECADNNGGCHHKCVNTGGSYHCECNGGYRLGIDGRSCFAGTASDKCLDNNGGCQQNCVVAGDNFYCSCDTGYSIYTDGKRCADVNECNTNPCPGDLRCSNNVGSYACSCPSGYTQSQNSCVDIDECNLNICEHTCTNRDGAYECGCRDGYTLYSHDARSCYRRSCVPGGDGCQCRRRDGVCGCDTGFEIGPGGIFCQDVDECSVDNGNCPLRCENRIGSYICTCPVGTELSDSTNTCVDVDECAVGTDLCEQGCVNTNGSYQCSCIAGYQLDGEYNCVDINECGSLTFDCSSNQFCVNTEGSYSCECSPGYTGSTDASLCEDLDECLGPNVCSQICINQVGAYRCGCNHGYRLSSFSQCTDIDECLATNTVCNEDHQFCRNSIGSYTCDCLFGYRINSTTNLCGDVDECALDRHSCQQTCVNLIGGYSCACKTGYEKKSYYTCRDLNECASPDTNTCSGQQNCINIVGSYICYCKSGFVSINGTCVDVDECEYGTCDHGCINTFGSYSCTCEEGYRLYRDSRSCYREDCSPGTAGCKCVPTDSSHCGCSEGHKLGNARIFCQDVNECAVENGGCSDSCTNTLGAHQCNCPSGLELSWDKSTCIEIVSCLDSNGGCEQNCEEVNPGVRCTCRNGFYLAADRKSCTVRPPCYQNGGCRQLCRETDGRAECSCSYNYQLAADGVSCIKNSFCYNDGACDQSCNTDRRICVCKEGFAFSRNGYNCADINECSLPHISQCSHSCENTAGSYICTCPDGYWLDENGKICIQNSEGCGGSLFSEPSGTLPAITGPYPLKCVWKLKVPEGQLALFRIHYLTFGLAYNCEEWGIEVWDPRAPNYTLVAKQCHGVFEEYVSSVGSELWIKIRAETDMGILSSFFYYSINDNVFGSSECHQSLTAGTNFSSPNFPLPYNPTSQCTTYISGDNQFITLQFFFFNTEWSSNCDRDYVVVRDVQYNYNIYSRPLAKLCGNKVPDLLYSSTGKFAVTFHSDSSVEMSGYYATTF